MPGVQAPGTIPGMSTKTKKKPHRETLFPLPKNRKRTPTDAETLLHALCIAIRDHKSHAVLRGLIAHLPRIMNRANPYTATAQDNFALTERVGKLEDILRRMLPRLKRQTARDIALAVELNPQLEQPNATTENSETAQA